MNLEPSPALPANRAGLSAYRPLLIGLAVLALVLSGIYLSLISRTDPWFRNTDMNIHNLVDALSINSNVVPARIEQPGFLPKYLLALDYRIRHYAGFLPVWNLDKFAASQDPLSEIRSLVKIGRWHSRGLVILFILSAAGLSYAVIRKIETACLTTVLLCGSSGLLFHGLLTRPELLCAWLGGVLALGCTWQGVSSPPGPGQRLWLFLAGLFVGLATLAQWSGVFYLALCLAWCWLAAATTGRTETPALAHPAPSIFRSGLLPVISSLVVLWLAHCLTKSQAAPGPAAAQRLRIVTMLVGTLPLLGLWSGRSRFWLFLLGRSRELALLGGGALAALPLGYLLLRAVMTAPRTLDYLAGIFSLVFSPGPFLKGFFAAQPDLGRGALRLIQDSPFLFLIALAATFAVVLARTIPSRLKAFTVLLLASALGATLLLSFGHSHDQYSLFIQVPLLLLVSLSLSALIDARTRQPAATNDMVWPVPVIFTATCVVLLTVYLRLRPKYDSFQPDGGRPVSDLTVTLLYEHNAHPRAYVQIMADRYGNRKQFVQVLERYLDDPANRY